MEEIINISPCLVNNSRYCGPFPVTAIHNFPSKIGKYLLDAINSINVFLVNTNNFNQGLLPKNTFTAKDSFLNIDNFFNSDNNNVTGNNSVLIILIIEIGEVGLLK